MIVYALFCCFVGIGPIRNLTTDGTRRSQGAKRPNGCLRAPTAQTTGSSA
jgi:hypothetical protein